jgi:hypothetical protein
MSAPQPLTLPYSETYCALPYSETYRGALITIDRHHGAVRASVVWRDKPETMFIEVENPLRACRETVDRMLEPATSDGDQAGVTIAAAMAKGLPPLPWSSAPSHGNRLVLVAADGTKIGAVWGEQPRLVVETILALVNGPAAECKKITTKGASDAKSTKRSRPRGGGGPLGDSPFDNGGAWGGD